MIALGAPLAGKKALIVGVANNFSIAWAIAQAFHEAGAQLLLTYQGDRTRDSVERLAVTLPDTLTAPLEVMEGDQRFSLFKLIAERWGSLDVLVHSIAYADKITFQQPFVETTYDQFTEALGVSAWSLIALADGALPLLRKSGGGSIIDLTYYGGEKVTPPYNLMGVAKAALDMTMRYLAYDLGKYNIRVNGISSAPVSTASGKAIPGFSTIVKMVAESSPLPQRTEKSSLGATATFLASDAARQITGEIIHVDGGYHIMGITVPSKTE